MPARPVAFLLVAAIAVFGCGVVFAQASTDEVGAQIKDVVFTADGSHLYAAAFDRNEVWKFKTGSSGLVEVSAPVAKVAVGKGPSALAISSDGTILACANSISGTVSFIKVADFDQGAAPYATIECGKGVSKLAALPGNRIAAAGHFSDSISVIDPLAASASPTEFKIGAAINDIAASGNLLAVACGMPTVLQVFDTETLRPVAMIQLTGRPTNVIAIRDGVFAVSLPSRIVAVDARKHEVIAEGETTPKDLAFDGNRILALEDKTIAAFDGQLTLLGRMPIDTTGVAVRARGDVIVVLPSRTRQWWTALLAIVPEGAPGTESARVAWRRSEAAKAPKGKTATGDYTHMPISGFESGAPRPGTIQGGGPAVGPKRKTITGALSEKFAFNPTDAFQPPDLAQPPRDVEGNDLEITQDGGMTGKNVRLRLGSMDFSADDFEYTKATSSLYAAGNVMMWQDPSLFSADEVTYRQTSAETGSGLLLRPLASEDQDGKSRKGSGVVDAKNALIIQPTQELAAGHLCYDVANMTGEIEDAHGRAGIYYFGAKKLRVLGPASLDGEDVWVTTCDHDPPHYRVRVKKFAVRDGNPTYAQSSQLQIGSMLTPLYWPVWGSAEAQGGLPMSFDFVAGRRARIGYFINTGEQFSVSPDMKLGLRLYPTTKAGVGAGLESEYDFTKTPSSPLFLSKGTFRSLWTTDDEGYLELHHRQELMDDTILLLNVEHWSNEEFYRDFFYDQYKNRTGPRSFANVTYTQPEYVASGTVRVDTTDFTRETERLPELSFHLIEREILPHFYGSFDTIDGYNEREPYGYEALRLLNVGRLTYDINLHEALSITPFAEFEATYYSAQRDREDSDASRLTATTGVTVQTRLHKAYPGMLGFSGFKHVIVPSLTLSHRPSSSLDPEDAPRFDAYDAITGCTRLETKIDNVIYGRDTATENVWQVARLTLTCGYDYWNESQPARDYGAEFDVRPRPYYGWLLKGQHHSIDDDFDRMNVSFYRETFLRAYEKIHHTPYQGKYSDDYLRLRGDYDSVLTYFYYDNTSLQGRWDGRLGFAYTETNDIVYNREILYGMGYKLGEKWGVAFEHRFDIEREQLALQKYEIRRSLHCWEAAFTFRERRSGWDVGVEFSLAAFPGTRLKF